MRTWIFLYIIYKMLTMGSIDHYSFGSSHASDIIPCLNWSLLGITNHI